MNSQVKRKTQKIMLQPINQIFHFFTSKQKVQIWLYDHKELFLEGVIQVSFLHVNIRVEEKLLLTILNHVYIMMFLQGFDEYMNIVLDQASEVYTKKDVKKVTNIGKLLLRGENISLICECK